MWLLKQKGDDLPHPFTPILSYVSVHFCEVWLWKQSSTKSIEITIKCSVLLLWGRMVRECPFGSFCNCLRAKIHDPSCKAVGSLVELPPRAPLTFPIRDATGSTIRLLCRSLRGEILSFPSLIKPWLENCSTTDIAVRNVWGGRGTERWLQLHWSVQVAFPCYIQYIGQ